MNALVEQLSELLCRLGVVDHHEAKLLGGKSADLAHVHCDLNADVTAADNNDVLAEVDLALKNIPCVDNLNALVSGDGRNACLGAAGEDDAVEVLGGGEDILCGGFLIEDDFNAQLAAGAVEPLSEVADVESSRRSCGEERQTDGAVSLLPDGNLVAAESGDTGKFKAGGACADDEDLFGMLALYLGGKLAVFVFKLCLAVALVVADAADGLVRHGHVEAQGVAAHAGADSVDTSGHGLLDGVGVCKERTTHDDSVKVAALDKLFRLFHVHAHTLRNGSLDACLDGAAEVRPRGVGNLHGDKGHRGLVPACGDGEAVNIAGLVKQLADIADIVSGAAAVHEVRAADAQRDGVVGADRLADTLKGLDHEAGAADDVAAVLVGAVVGEG